MKNGGQSTLAKDQAVSHSPTSWYKWLYRASTGLDILTLADELAKSEDEAALRSAISRAYYYVYHLALDRAEKNDFTPVLGGAHVQLWRFFGGSPDPTCRRLGDLGS